MTVKNIVGKNPDVYEIKGNARHVWPQIIPKSGVSA